VFRDDRDRQEYLDRLQRTTAYLSGLKDAKIVGRWAASRVRPRELSSFRLRTAYQAARLIIEAFGDQTAKAWFFGTNSQLDDEAPAHVLRHSGSPEKASAVVRAARSLAEAGRRSAADSGTRASEQSTRLEPLHFVRLLVREIRRYNEEVEAGSRPIPGPTRQQVSSELDEVVKRLKRKLRISESATP
jgi:hypothetical protein